MLEEFLSSFSRYAPSNPTAHLLHKSEGDAFAGVIAYILAAITIQLLFAFGNGAPGYWCIWNDMGEGSYLIQPLYSVSSRPANTFTIQPLNLTFLLVMIFHVECPFCV